MLLGNNAGANDTTASDVTCIGAVGANVDNSCYIGQIFGVTSSEELLSSLMLMENLAR